MYVSSFFALLFRILAYAALRQFVAEQIERSKFTEPTDRVYCQYTLSLRKTGTVVKAGHGLPGRWVQMFRVDVRTHNKTSLLLMVFHE
jgi:hypothetical protein